MLDFQQSEYQLTHQIGYNNQARDASKDCLIHSYLIGARGVVDRVSDDILVSNPPESCHCMSGLAEFPCLSFSESGNEGMALFLLGLGTMTDFKGEFDPKVQKAVEICQRHGRD